MYNLNFGRWISVGAIVAATFYTSAVGQVVDYSIKKSGPVASIDDGYVSVDAYVTSGAGTMASPYTGWDTNIKWTAGYKYRFGPHVYSFNSLSISVPVTWQGIGGTSIASTIFGHTSWLQAGNSFGTIILATATSGNALTFNTDGPNYAYNLRDLMLIGPGTGTSVGIALGSEPHASVQSKWSNVYIANFSQCAAFNNVEDGTFDHLRMNGCTVGLIANLNANQNVFLNLQVQHAESGVKFVHNAQNVVLGALVQNVTTGFTFSDTQTTSVKGLYGEASTNLFYIDSSTNGVKNLDISDVYASVTNLFAATGVYAVNYFTLRNVQWGNGSITIPQNFINTVIQSVELSFLSTIHDYGHNTIICDGVYGCKFPNVSTGSITHSKAEVDTSYSYNIPANNGTVTMSVGSQRAILEPANTLDSLTVVLPPFPSDGQIAGVSSTSVIGTLTVKTSDGSLVLGTPTALSANGGRQFLYRSKNKTWYPTL